MRMSVDESGERKRIAHLLRESDPRLGLRWGFSVAAREHYEDSGYGHLDIITPHERTGFTRGMLEAAATQKLFWQGVAECRLFLPDMVREMGLWHMLPAVDVVVRASIKERPLSVMAQIPWEIAIENPVPILSRRPIPEWPR